MLSTVGSNQDLSPYGGQKPLHDSYLLTLNKFIAVNISNSFETNSLEMFCICICMLEQSYSSAGFLFCLSQAPLSQRKPAEQSAAPEPLLSWGQTWKRVSSRTPEPTSVPSLLAGPNHQFAFTTLRDLSQ